MLDSDLLLEFIKFIAIAILIVPLFQSISLLAIQICLIVKHELPLSGVKWFVLIPGMIKNYLNFLFGWNGAMVYCKLENGKGGFEWRGTFKWKVW